MDVSGGLAGIAAGAAMVLAGWRAYSGRWRRWLAYTGLIPGVRSYPGLGLLYGGISFLLAPAAVWTAEAGAPKAAVAALIVPVLAGMLIWLLSHAWLPRFMRPEWVRATERNEELYARHQGDG
ncbi:hypothetical protein [Crystallibacter degradans]|uniref:hypothetical protein n=1 Tax=Crystallibacter degradans TaxID=2726743 RepID=UPI0014748419|nr:hypothetical protein [Arthrobacter sp. SF27]NMR29747.1 hypothetical protein [Arthrobacter sp. SF27]